jgi:hypothetical protein
MIPGSEKLIRRKGKKNAVKVVSFIMGPYGNRN